MGTLNENLIVDAEVRGADEAAKKLDSVNDAQVRVKDQTAKGAVSAGTAADAQEKLNASESDFTSLLTQISPALGGFVDAMIKGSKIAGDLSTKNIELGKVVGGVTSAVKKNANAMKLLLAGGAAVAAVLALVAAWEKMKDEIEKVNQKLERQQDLQNELKGVERDRQAAIEKISDQRRGGGFNADQARRAVSTAQSISDQFGDISPEAIDQVVGLGFDSGLSRDQLTRAAFLVDRGKLDVNAGASAEARRRQIERAIQLNQPAIDQFFARENRQAAGLASDAATEAVSPNSSTLALRDVIKRTSGDLSEEEVNRIVKLISLISTTSELDKATIQGALGNLAFAPFEAIYAIFSGKKFLVPEGRSVGLEDPNQFFIEDGDVNNLRAVLRAIEKNPGGGKVTIINNQGGNVIPESGQTQAGMRVNADSAARDAELVGGL